MYYFIGIEDLVANALIELVEKTGNRTVSFSQLNKYGDAIVAKLKASNMDVTLIYTRDSTEQFFKFESGFKKEDLSNTPIFFPELGKTYPLGKLINLFTIKDISRHAFFYVYYRKAPNDTIDAQQVGREIAKLVLGKS